MRVLCRTSCGESSFLSREKRRRGRRWPCSLAFPLGMLVGGQDGLARREAQVSSPGALLKLCQLCRHRVFFCLSSRQVCHYKPRLMLVTKLCAAVSPFPFPFFCWALAQQVAACCSSSRQHGASLWPWLLALWPCHILAIAQKTCIWCDALPVN